MNALAPLATVVALATLQQEAASAVDAAIALYVTLAGRLEVLATFWARAAGSTSFAYWEIEAQLERFRTESRQELVEVVDQIAFGRLVHDQRSAILGRVTLTPRLATYLANRCWEAHRTAQERAAELRPAQVVLSDGGAL